MRASCLSLHCTRLPRGVEVESCAQVLLVLWRAVSWLSSCVQHHANASSTFMSAFDPRCAKLWRGDTSFSRDCIHATDGPAKIVRSGSAQKMRTFGLCFLELLASDLVDAYKRSVHQGVGGAIRSAGDHAPAVAGVHHHRTAQTGAPEHPVLEIIEEGCARLANFFNATRISHHACTV